VPIIPIIIPLIPPLIPPIIPIIELLIEPTIVGDPRTNIDVTTAPKSIRIPPIRLRTKGAAALVSLLIPA